LLKTAEKNVKFVCAIEKIASELKIEVTQKDFNDYFEKVSRLYGMSIDDVKKQYHRNLTNIEAFIFQKKIFSELQKFYK
jgi:FKBP-type peptidyl-prolyl cis-trans isomerase (trigger factor)